MFYAATSDLEISNRENLSVELGVAVYFVIVVVNYLTKAPFPGGGSCYFVRLKMVPY